MVQVNNNIEPKIVNFIAAGTPRFESTQIDSIIESQIQAEIEGLDDVELSEFAENYLRFYNSNNVEFSVEALESPNIQSQANFDFVAFRLFKQIDVSENNRVSAQEIRDFLDKADFYLREVGALSEGRTEALTEFSYFGTRINDILREVESEGSQQGLLDFVQKFQGNVESDRINTFRNVLDSLIDIIEDSRYNNRPVAFDAFI